MTKREVGNLSATGIIATAAAAIPALGNTVATIVVGVVLMVWGGLLVGSVIFTAKPALVEQTDAGAIAPATPQSTTTDATDANEGAPAASLLGPEDAEALEKMGYRLREFPTFRRWERPTIDAAANFEEIEVVLVKEGNRIAYASVFDIHNQCAWQKKSPSRFVYENGSPCDLGKQLSNEKYQRRLRPATDVIFLGAESFPNSPVERECHGTLSHCRYLELATEAYKAEPDDWSVRRYWGLDLGRALDDDTAHEFDQRRALIVGLKERISTAPLPSVVRDIVFSTTIKDVVLGRYSSAGMAEPKPLDIVDRSTDPHAE